MGIKSQEGSPEPIKIKRSDYLEHCHIMGSSRSGKTALSLTPTAEQFIRHARTKQELDESNGKLEEDD